MKRFSMSTILSVAVLFVFIVTGYAGVQQPRLDAISFFNLGNAYFIKGQYTQAIFHFSKAIEIDPKFFDAYNNRGKAYHSRGDFNKAISDYNKAIEIDLRFTDAYNNRGNAHAGKGQYEQAI